MPRPAQRNAAVPAAARPGSLGQRGTTLCGYRVMRTQQTAYSKPLGEGEIEADPVAKIMRMRATTYTLLHKDFGAMGHLVHEAAEAVRTMKVTMIDVSSYSSAPTRSGPRPKPQVALQGIKLLTHELQLLVTDMARLNTSNPTAVSDAVGRYSRLREQVAAQRAEFAEAEQRFEIIQEQLFQKLGGDE